MDPIVPRTRNNRESQISRLPSPPPAPLRFPSPSLTRPRHQPKRNKKKSCPKRLYALPFGSLAKSLFTLLCIITFLAWAATLELGRRESHYNISKTDAFFAATTSSTGTGLNSVNMSTFNIRQRILLQMVSYLTCPMSVDVLTDFWNISTAFHRSSNGKQRLDTMTSEETLVGTEPSTQSSAPNLNDIELDFIPLDMPGSGAEHRSPDESSIDNLDFERVSRVSQASDSRVEQSTPASRLASSLDTTTEPLTWSREY